MSVNEQRRSKRKAAEGVIQVVNAMTGEVMGRIGNLSIDGVMLMANTTMREDALFQILFHLPDDHGNPVALELGVHEQWSEPASVPGQYWAGFRIIDVAPRDFEVLKAWIGADSTH